MNNESNVITAKYLNQMDWNNRDYAVVGIFGRIYKGTKEETHESLVINILKDNPEEVDYLELSEISMIDVMELPFDFFCYNVFTINNKSYLSYFTESAINNKNIKESLKDFVRSNKLDLITSVDSEVKITPYLDFLNSDDSKALNVF